MFCYSHFLSPGLLGRGQFPGEDRGPLGLLLQDKVTMLRTKSLLKYNTTERCGSALPATDLCKRRLDIHIKAPDLPKSSAKSVILKVPRRLMYSSRTPPGFPALPKTLPRSQSPCTVRTITPSLRTPKKALVPKFEHKGVLGVVGNSSLSPASELSHTRSKQLVLPTQVDQWLKELREFTRSVDRRATDWYEELDYDSKGFISRQDILDRLRLQRYTSPRFQYQRQTAFFAESAFASLGPAPPAAGLTERLIVETEEAFQMLKLVGADSVERTDIVGLTAVFDFNSPSKRP